MFILRIGSAFQVTIVISAYPVATLRGMVKENCTLQRNKIKKQNRLTPELLCVGIII